MYLLSLMPTECHSSVIVRVRNFHLRRWDISVFGRAKSLFELQFGTNADHTFLPLAALEAEDNEWIQYNSWIMNE